MHSSHESPDKVLLNFIERLPTTIREIVLCRCCKAFGRLQIIPKQDLFATFRAIMREGEDETRAYTCAKMIAVVDLALQDDECQCEADFDRELCEATGARRFSSVDLRAPLTQKLWQAARNEFLALRNGALSMGSLREMLTDLHDQRPRAGRARTDGRYAQQEASLSSGR